MALEEECASLTEYWTKSRCKQLYMNQYFDAAYFVRVVRPSNQHVELNVAETTIESQFSVRSSVSAIIQLLVLLRLYIILYYILILMLLMCLVISALMLVSLLCFAVSWQACLWDLKVDHLSVNTDHILINVRGVVLINGKALRFFLLLSNRNHSSKINTSYQSVWQEVITVAGNSYMCYMLYKFFYINFVQFTLNPLQVVLYCSCTILQQCASPNLNMYFR